MDVKDTQDGCRCEIMEAPTGLQHCCCGSVSVLQAFGDSVWAVRGGVLDESWRPLGGVLEAVFEPLGGLLGAVWVPLESQLGLLGAS